MEDTMSDFVMEDDYEEYTTFKVTSSEGKEVEMAVLEEFEYDHDTYVAAAEVEGDTINEDGVYIYKASLSDGELIAEKIMDKELYSQVVKAYMELD